VIEPSKIVAAPVAQPVVEPVAAPVVEPLAAPVVEPVAQHVDAPKLIGAAAAASAAASAAVSVPINTLVIVPPQITMDDNSTDSSNPCWDKESVALLIGVGLLGLMITPILAIMFPVIRGVDNIIDSLVQEDDVKYKVE